MTLIVALACKNGIVVASDGQATGGSAGGPIRMPIQKIYPINSHVLFGASGSVGVIQKSKLVIFSLSQELDKEWDSESMEKVRNALFGVYKNEIDRHRTFYKDTPYEDIKNAPIADVLLCNFIKKGENEQKIIWHIAPDCSDEMLDEIGYGCSGSGDVFAHTLLKNYPIKELDVERGKLVAYRVIKEAIEIGAYGLGEPIDMWTITEEGCKHLSDEELMALEDTYHSWKELERKIFEKIYSEKNNHES
jgi:20S proteasome alpha/beta subunit